MAINKFTAVNMPRDAGDNTQYFTNQWGELYYLDPETNKHVRAESNGGDQQWGAGEREALEALYSKYGLDPAMMRGGGEEMTRPTEINGGLYLPVANGYFDPHATYDGYDPAIAQARAAARQNMYTDPEGNSWARPQDVLSTNQMIAPHIPQDLDFFTNMPLLMGLGVAGAGAAGAFGGGSIFGGAGLGGGSLGGIGGGAGGAGLGGLSAETASFLANAGYSSAEIAALGAQYGAGGALTGIAGAGATIPEWLKPFMPTPQSAAVSAATQLANSGGGDVGTPWDSFGTDEAAGATGLEAPGGGSTSSGIWDILKNAPLSSLSTLLGGLGGYLSGKSPNEAQSSTDVPAWLKPYYSMGLDAGLQQLAQSKDLTPEEKATIARMQQGLGAPNAGLDAANKTITDTASGKYLDLANNPQWQEAARQIGTNYNETIRPGTDAAFSRAGAMGVGNSAWEEMTARNNRALATGLGTAGAGLYGQERQNQLNASTNMPAFQTQYLTGLGNQSLQLGNYQRTQPWQGILNYGQLLGSLKGPSVTTQQTSANPWQTAAGGAMAGYGLSNLWGNSNTSTANKTLSSLWG